MEIVAAFAEWPVGYDKRFNDYLRSKMIPPHNSRRQALIKRSVLVELKEKVDRYVIFNDNSFGYEVHTDVLNRAFKGLHELLKHENSTFRVKGSRLKPRKR